MKSRSAVLVIALLVAAAATAAVFMYVQSVRSNVRSSASHVRVIGIPKGEEAITVALESQKVPAQVVQPGDRVSVYATFSQVSVIAQTKLSQFLNGGAPANNNLQQLGDFTLELIPDAQVLRVSR